MQDHSFFPDPTNKARCALCKRTMLDAHSPLSSCEACGKVTAVILFGPADNPKSMLLCVECSALEIKAAVNASQQDIKENGQARVDSMLSLARENDAAIRYNGDFFNAKTIALETIRNEINTSPELTTDEKAFKFQSYLAERIKHLKAVVFDLDEKKHQAIVEEQVCRKSLREMEKDLRKEIREQIKQTDSQYNAPEVKQVKPKIKKATTSTYDRLVESFMTMFGCSKEIAEEKIRAGSGGKLGKLPL